MKKIMLAVLLCAMVLSVLCVPVGATTVLYPQEIMKNQISDAEMAILSNVELYSEEGAIILKTIDFSKATIVVAHMDALMELGEQPLENAIEAGEKYYYIEMYNSWYRIIVKEKGGSYECSLWEITKADRWGNREKMNPAVVSVADLTFFFDEICGKTRDVLEMYVFIEYGMDALVSVTTEGTFVRFYTGVFAEDGNTELYQDMTMEEYSAWVAAFRNFKIEYNTVAYDEFGDPNINTLGELVHKYETPDAYYQDMQQIHLRKDREDFWFPIIVTSGIFLAVAFAAWVIWRRRVNQKEYGY